MDASTIDRFAAQLSSQLQSAAHGQAGQRRMAPELAYGRHRGPAPATARAAAVLLLLFPGADDWIMPAIVRPMHMKWHPGQIALPGGIVEQDESTAEAALREFREELGAATDGITLLGALAPVYVFASDTLVTPHIALVREQPIWKPNADEVASVVHVELRSLVDPRVRGRHTIERHSLAFEAPHFEIAGQRIWGATAMMLSEFAEVCAAAGLLSVTVADSGDLSN